MNNGRHERLFTVLFVILVVTVILTNIMANNTFATHGKDLELALQDRLKETARVATTLVTWRELNLLNVPEDSSRSIFRNIRARLQTFAERVEIKYVYFMRVKDGELQYIVDSDPDPETMSLPGEITDFDNYVREAFAGNDVSSDLGVYAGIWEGYMTAYSPVFDNYGNVVAVAGVDISDAELRATIMNGKRINSVLMGEIIAMIFICLILIFIYVNRAKRADHSARVKSDFLSRMSHEIRTPMNAVIGLSRMSRASDDLEQIHSYLDKIGSSSKYLLSLINNILDMSKIESGHVQLEYLNVSVPDLIESIAMMIKPQMDSKGVEFTVENAVGGRFMTDSTRLTQILMNLLGNACKFTPAGGKVTLTASGEPAADGWCRLRFAVKDTGAGINENAITKIFTPFEQEDASTTRKYGGTGLGLSISKLLVSMMGGDIAVESTLGEGSTFSFDILAEPSEDNEIIDAEECDADADCSGMRFLLAEDNEINRMVAEDALSSFGAEVILAENGAEAVAKYIECAGEIDVVFMDIQMPVMDGYEATRKIRESDIPNAKTIPIIAMTANVMREDVEESRSAGMNAHVGKPFEPREINDALRKVLKIA